MIGSCFKESELKHMMLSQILPMVMRHILIHSNCMTAVGLGLAMDPGLGIVWCPREHAFMQSPMVHPGSLSSLRMRPCHYCRYL